MTNRKNMRFISFILASCFMASAVLTGCNVSVAKSADAGSTEQIQTEERPAEDTTELKDTTDLKDKVLTDLPTKWDLTCLYADEDAFEADMKRAEELIPEIEKLRGTLNSVEGILNDLENPALLEEKAILNKAAMYAKFLNALDPTDPWAVKATARYNDVFRKQAIAYAFEDAEIMQMPLEKRIEIFSDERLAPYAYVMKKYTDPDYVVLSEDAMTVKALMKSAQNQLETRNILDFAELPVPTFTYPDGTEGKLTEEEFSRIVGSDEYDRDFRKEITMLHYSIRAPYVNTFASLLEGVMRGNWAEAQIKGYDSSRAAALADTDVSPEVYDRIIEFAHDMLPQMYKYFEAKKEIEGLDEMMTFDIRKMVSDYSPRQISYEEAVNMGRAGVAVWGDDYLEKFDEIIESPHIDVYPADRKAGGAFELLDGNETTPFVLYNFDGTEPYTSTIVHEMGHAVYSEYSAENQNVFNNAPTIFTQEVASTANEIMFHRYMIENAKSDEEKLYWLEQEIALFNQSIFNQCLFAEFEDYCYKTIEGGGALSADDLSDKYLELLRLYYGDNFTIPDEAGTGWTSIDHFFNNYYVYQYATSITYAASICNRVDEKGQEETDAYIDFLKAGKSADPATLLSIAGVDPLDDATYDAAGKLISDLIDEFIATAQK